MRSGRHIGGPGPLFHQLSVADIGVEHRALPREASKSRLYGGIGSRTDRAVARNRKAAWAGSGDETSRNSAPNGLFERIA